MTWKAIGQKSTGVSHLSSGRDCEDALNYCTLVDGNGSEVLVCCVCDGAGSALHGGFASAYTAAKVIDFTQHALAHKEEISEAHIYAMAEDIFYGLEHEALARNVSLNEFSCTMLGCIVSSQKATFFQVGDGAIVRSDKSGFYSTVWWPQNGEYHNSTSFLVDDRSFGNLQVAIIEDEVDEIAIFTDGLQLLTLNTESHSVHQPFFSGLFPRLRMADDNEKINILNRKLADYLGSPQINERTDDDKTLFLATRLPV